MSERVYISHPKEPWGLSVRSATHTASENPLGLEERMMVAQSDELASLRTENARLREREKYLKEQLEACRKIEWAFTNRYIGAFEKYNKAKDNTEATQVFREFLKEPWVKEKMDAAIAERDELQMDRERLNAIFDRNIIETIDFMGTTVPYWTIWTADGRPLTTAEHDAKTIMPRDIIDAAIAGTGQPVIDRKTGKKLTAALAKADKITKGE